MSDLAQVQQTENFRLVMSWGAPLAMLLAAFAVNENSLKRETKSTSVAATLATANEDFASDLATDAGSADAKDAGETDLIDVAVNTVSLESESTPEPPVPNNPESETTEAVATDAVAKADAASDPTPPIEEVETPTDISTDLSSQTASSEPATLSDESVEVLESADEIPVPAEDQAFTTASHDADPSNTSETTTSEETVSATDELTLASSADESTPTPNVDIAELDSTESLDSAPSDTGVETTVVEPSEGVALDETSREDKASEAAFVSETASASETASSLVADLSTEANDVPEVSTVVVEAPSSDPEPASAPPIADVAASESIAIESTEEQVTTGETTSEANVAKPEVAQSEVVPETVQTEVVEPGLAEPGLAKPAPDPQVVSDPLPSVVEVQASSSEEQSNPTTPSETEATKPAKKAFLGVGIRNPQNAIVTTLYGGSAAEKLGILIGDELLTVNKKKVTNVETLRDVLKTIQVGDEVTVTIRRNGRINTVGPQKIGTRD